MKDKLWIISGRLAAPFWQADGIVTWNGSTWILDEEKWMNLCAEEANIGKNMERWLGWTVWEDTGKTNLTPFMVDSDGKYILSFLNEKYFEILERMIQIANYPAQKPGKTAPGITIAIDLAFQYTNDPDDIRRSPFRNNTLGISSLYDPSAWPYFEAYALRLLDLRKKTHPITGQPLKIKYGMGNELLADGLEISFRIIRLMDREREWPFSWSICADIPSDGNDLFKELPKMIDREGLFLWAPERNINEWDTNIIRPVHGCGEIRSGVDIAETVFYYFSFHPIKWKGSDDGCRRKPGAAWWYEYTKKICSERNGQALTYPWEVQKPIIAVEHLPEDCDDPAIDVYTAIARAYEENFEPLENTGQWPDKWQKPVPPVPPAKCTLWSHLKRLNFKAAWEHIRGLHNKGV